jgi:hypothetical protein
MMPPEGEGTSLEAGGVEPVAAPPAAEGAPFEEDIVFEDATCIVYRLFDVADEIDLDLAETLLAGAARRLKLSRERSEYLEIPRAPLSVELGRREVAGQSGRIFQCTAHARLFGFGAVSVRYEIPPISTIDAASLAGLVRELEEADDIGRTALEETRRLCERLLPALDTPHSWEGSEMYTVVFTRSIPGPAPAAGFANDPRIAKVLLAEVSASRLSDQEVAEATQFAFSYTQDDLCVLDWNTAVVVEPDGSRDIPDVLEFATAQLLEFRFYDDIVDREMESLYAILGKPRDLIYRLSGRYRRLGRLLNRRILETVEFVERVDNSLKVIADSYLARVYTAALRCFRVPEWLAGVNRKQDLTRQCAEVLAAESQANTSHLLEIIIILLILFEVVSVAIQ